MRAFTRIVSSLLAAGAIALAGGAPAALAAPGESAQPYRLDLHDAWCFDDSPGLVYCFEVEGHAYEKLRESKDYKEGIAAFSAKRKPNFTGN